jgi:hypothetical protein
MVAGHGPAFRADPPLRGSDFRRSRRRHRAGQSVRPGCLLTTDYLLMLTSGGTWSSGTEYFFSIFSRKQGPEL